MYLKSDISGHLINAVQALAEHKPYFTSSVSETLLASFLTAQGTTRFASLTRTELWSDLLPKVIPTERLPSSSNLPHNCRQPANRNYAKLKLASAAALVLYAARIGLIEL